MAGPDILLVTDCAGDSVARTELKGRVHAITGNFPEIEGLPIALDPRDQIETAAYASHLLMRLLTASTTAIGRPPKPFGIGINGAPRDGRHPNGVPFCHFFYKPPGVLAPLAVTAPYHPQVLRMVRRYLGVSHVHLVDIREVLETVSRNTRADFSFDPSDIDFISSHQFRSLWFQPHYTVWVAQGTRLPSARVPVPEADDDEALRVSFADGFGNLFLNRTTGELSLAVGDVVVLPRFAGNAKGAQRVEVPCVAKLTDVDLGEPALVLEGKDDFPMLTIGCRPAQEYFNLPLGRRLELTRA